MHDPWTWTTVWGLPEGVVGTCGGGQGENWNNYNSINNKNIITFSYFLKAIYFHNWKVRKHRGERQKPKNSTIPISWRKVFLLWHMHFYTCFYTYICIVLSQTVYTVRKTYNLLLDNYSSFRDFSMLIKFNNTFPEGRMEKRQEEKEGREQGWEGRTTNKWDMQQYWCISK